MSDTTWQSVLFNKFEEFPPEKPGGKKKKSDLRSHKEQNQQILKGEVVNQEGITKCLNHNALRKLTLALRKLTTWGRKVIGLSLHVFFL